MVTQRPARILITDDEPNVRVILERSLRDQGYAIDLAVDGADAIRQIRQQTYDLILLDLRMPKVSGLQVLKEARAKDPESIVIILTAHGSMESAVEALRLGAFDYLFKPATPSEIRERVQAGLRQRQRVQQRQNLLGQIEVLKQLLHDIDTAEDTLTPPNLEARFIRSGKLTIDLHHRNATLDRQTLDLTTAEFDLLTCLVNAAPQPVSPQVLLAAALGYESEPAEARELIKWHIHHLRRKLEPNPARPIYIKTVRYQGYLWSGG